MLKKIKWFLSRLFAGACVVNVVGVAGYFIDKVSDLDWGLVIVVGLVGAMVVFVTVILGEFIIWLLEEYW